MLRSLETWSHLPATTRPHCTRATTPLATPPRRRTPTPPRLPLRRPERFRFRRRAPPSRLSPPSQRVSLGENWYNSRTELQEIWHAEVELFYKGCLIFEATYHVSNPYGTVAQRSGSGSAKRNLKDHKQPCGSVSGPPGSGFVIIFTDSDPDHDPSIMKQKKYYCFKPS